MIPPPLNPRPTGGYTNSMMVPFLLAESNRMLLNFLALDSQLPQRHRELIASWVLQHNRLLEAHLVQSYGWAGAQQANQIAISMAQEFLGEIKKEKDSQENDLFTRLEEEMKRDTE